MTLKLVKLLILFSLLFCISCGKESTHTHSQTVEKGSGKLVLSNSEEVLSYLRQFETADINEQVDGLAKSAPEEKYVLFIDDIEKGDYLNIESVDVTQWLTSEQKGMVRDHEGCMTIKFYDSVYTPETQDSASLFVLGDISFQDSNCK